MISRKLAGFTLLVLSYVLLTGFAFGQKDFAQISNQGTSVAWRVDAQFKSLTLTVSAPDGETYSQVFPAGATPVFDVRFGDGGYNYEITLSPVLAPGVEKMLKQARIDGTDEAVAADLKQRGLLPEPMISSGSFKVVEGRIFTATDSVVETEGVRTRNDETPGETKTIPKTSAGDTDVPGENVMVINDDLVVVGSECVGLDCVAGEVFSFDTLRLKENNLRIHFNDTSSTSSFPTSDWRIIANDSANGGASYLAFEDSDAATQPFRVESGAGASALFVRSTSGNVGMGTSAPVLELHIADGDSPSVRLEQTGASGFTPQVWDVAGNESNFFVRDVTNGSRLVFRIIPGAPTSSLHIASDGDVGVGTSSPEQKLDVDGSVQVSNNGSLILESGSTGGIVFADGTTQSTAAGMGTGDITTAANVGASGAGVFAQKNGTILEFKNIKAGANVTVTPTGSNEIEIASTTAAPLGPTYATTIFGGSGDINPVSTLAPTFDANSYGTGVTGAGFAVLLYDIPGNSNLADPGGTNVVIKIRYRDSDGVAAATSVTVSQVTINVANGARTVNSIFSSNTDPGTGFQTVTVCKPANFFNFSTLGNHLNVALVSAAATNADFTMVQIYKTNGACP